jgi:hypothetical protein
MGIGIGSGGRAYNVQRPNELKLLIRAVQDWKARATDEQSALAGDPWAFANWLDGVSGADRRQFRHMLLHLLFPQMFERVSSGADKRKIDSEFRTEIEGESLPPEEVAPSLVARDRRLLRIRHALQQKDPGAFIDFYQSNFLGRWKPPTESSDDGADEPKTTNPATPPVKRVTEPAASNAKGYEEPALDEIVDSIQNDLRVSARTIRRYHLALRSRGFVILSGVSGTGKTWLAEQYARAVGAQYLVVAVAPNWTTNEDLLGFTDPFKAVTTNLQDLIASAGQAGGGTWTVPRWAVQGDVVFFYHAKKALSRINSLMPQLKAMAPNVRGSDRRLLADAMNLLLQERELTIRFGGSIFACARITGRAEVNLSEEERTRSKHWRSPIYGPIAQVHVFERPLSYDVFGRYVTLSTGSITPLEAPAFNRLRSLLSAENALPGYVVNARIASEGFRDVTADNWKRISCTAGARFRDEAQLRVYLIDHLLRELKDPATQSTPSAVARPTHLRALHLQWPITSSASRARGFRSRRS